MRRTTRLPHLGLAFLCLTLRAPVASSQAPTITHGFCTVVLGGTQYFSGVFSAPMEKDPRGADPTYHTSRTWGRAFSDHVTQKYGGQAAAGSCGLQASVAEAQTGRTSAIDLNRRLSRKVLEIDWAPTSATPPESATPPTPAPAASSGQTPPPNASAQGTTMRGVCWSDLNGPVIYFSQVFDTGRGRGEPGEDIFSPIGNEFHQYLKGRYDYTTSATRAAQCAGQLSQGQASAQRSEVMTRFATGKRVVELEWEFSPGAAEAAPGVTAPQDHGYCVSPGATGTVYTAGPFQLKGRVATYEWNRAFSQFLAGKYAFQGEVSCAIGMPQVRAQRWFSFHVQGARAANRKVVETGWELGAAAPSGAAAAQPNEANANREPAMGARLLQGSAHGL